MDRSLAFRTQLERRLVLMLASATALTPVLGGLGCSDEQENGSGAGGDTTASAGAGSSQETQCFPWPEAGAGGGGGEGGAAGGGGSGGVGVGGAGRGAGSGGASAPPCPSRKDALSRFPTLGSCNGVMSVDSDGMLAAGSCCYTVTISHCIGRPLVIGGAGRWARAGRARPSSRWADPRALPRTMDLPASEREALAEHWTRDALLEHASVASFARFALELLAHGAPSDLVESAHLAALDEVRHARLCFGLASAYAGRELAPTELALGSSLTIASTLPELADALCREGCVGETLAAIQAAEQEGCAEDGAVRTVLRVIAADEARHAELAWRTLRWALEIGGAEVRAAARAAFAATAPRPADEALAIPGDTAVRLRARGVLDPAAAALVRIRGWRDVVLPSVRVALGAF